MFYFTCDRFFTCVWYKAVTVDGTMYETSGVVSGGLGDLLGKSSQWTMSSDRAQARTDRRRDIHNELSDLLRLQTQRRQPTSQINVKIDAQNKLLQVAEEQKQALVRLLKNLVICSLVINNTSWHSLDCACCFKLIFTGFTAVKQCELCMHM